METSPKTSDDRSDEHHGFRLLLLAGGVVTIGTAVAALGAHGILKSALGLKVAPASPGFSALARLYGGVTLAVGIGYLLAAVDPVRQRGLLLLLFLVPLSDLVLNVVGIASAEMSGLKAGLFAGLDLVYCLLYVRLYPRAGTK